MTSNENKEPTPVTADTVESHGQAPEPATDQERLSQEIQELKDKYLRTAAEMENVRRRMEKEKSDLIKYSLENVFREFLPALDSLEKALPDSNDSQMSDKGPDRSYFEGMIMVKRQLLEVFKKHGLEAIHAQGSLFDPNFHQAIQRVESADVERDTVGQEFVRGYMLNGRLLRPAMVSVLTPAGG